MTSRLPPLDIVDPRGRRHRVHVHTPLATVADLAAALGIGADVGLSIGGRPVGPQDRLVSIDELVEGARVEAGAVRDEPSIGVVTDVAPLEFAVDAGRHVAPGLRCRLGESQSAGRHTP